MLSVLIFFPLCFGLSLFFLPKSFLYRGAILGSLIQFFLSLLLFFLFDPSSPDLQLVEKTSLISFFGIHYFVALDGLSFWYILLSCFLLPLVVLASSKQKSPLYFFFLFSLVSLSQGAFLSFDAILFYIFFELSLLPLFFMIYLWGGEKKLYASFKFLIYTFFASLFLLGGFLALMLIHKSSFGEISASLLDFYKLDFVFIQNQAFSTQSLLFFCFTFAFAVKTPLVPFHTWLPLAHVEAPTGASVYLAAILLKLGTYGWFRFVLPLFPEAATFYSPFLLFLAVFSLIYSSLLAFAQTDIKKLVAYSSVSHMALVLIGLFAFNIYGLQGAFYQTLSHGVSSAALFLLVGVLYSRTGTRDIKHFGGLSLSMPWLAILFFLVSLSAIALPLTAGFVSEFLILLGSYFSGEIWVWFAVLSVVLTAIYMLNLFQKIFLFKASPLSQKQKELNIYEFLYLTPFAFLVVFMGLCPNLFFKYSQASLNHLNKNQHNYSLSIYKSSLSLEKKKEDSKAGSALRKKRDSIKKKNNRNLYELIADEKQAVSTDFENSSPTIKEQQFLETLAEEGLAVLTDFKSSKLKEKQISDKQKSQSKLSLKEEEAWNLF